MVNTVFGPDDRGWPERVEATRTQHRYGHWWPQDERPESLPADATKAYVRADLYDAIQSQLAALTPVPVGEMAEALEELLSLIVDTHSMTPEYGAVSNILNRCNLARFQTPEVPK